MTHKHVPYTDIPDGAGLECLKELIRIGTNREEADFKTIKKHIWMVDTAISKRWIGEPGGGGPVIGAADAGTEYDAKLREAAQEFIAQQGVQPIDGPQAIGGLGWEALAMLALKALAKLIEKWLEGRG